MDFYHEQHSYHVHLVQNANEESDPDDETSWVMLSREGDVVQLPNENIFYKRRSRISLDLYTPSGLSASAPAFSVKSDSGTVYITTRRVIYLPAHPTEQLKSFSAPVLNFEDTYCSSGFFSPWYWAGLVKPVGGGNIPPGIPRLEIKLTFKEGGHDAFREAFETMKGRLQYAREVESETGQAINVDEQLPLYEAATSTPAGTAAAAAQTRAQAAAEPQPPRSEPHQTQQESSQRPQHQQSSAASGQSNQPLPDEPPPGYEEAQAQAVGARLEDSLREEADRQ